MSSTPIPPPGSTPPVPPYWQDEDDWIVLIEFLRRDDPEDYARATESIGYLFAYAQMTDTRMLALIGDPEANAYELLFSFSSPEDKADFLDLLRSNDVSDCEDEEILVPPQEEIEAAQPIARVLPEDVIRQVTAVAAMLRGGGASTIQ
ncbi:MULTISPECIES: hypothetical protein [Acidobacteriaceae]|uniref:hypothetical protein n=1 Tax=Acidobacteriaceae TaxID=204434 RepID=UPI00131BD996|nr:MULTISPECIES: hypothetical protein [Acidobacteriaceae]MDW5267413.1 hypothetical protein [Edaphobacter sp.]